MERDAVSVLSCELAPHLLNRFWQPLCLQGGSYWFFLEPCNSAPASWERTEVSKTILDSPTVEQHSHERWENHPALLQASQGLHILIQWTSRYSYGYRDHRDWWPCQADTGKPSNNICRHLSNSSGIWCSRLLNHRFQIKWNGTTFFTKKNKKQNK